MLIRAFINFLAFVFTILGFLMSVTVRPVLRLIGKKRMPPEIVNSSFTSGAMLTAFQLGLLVGEYSYEQREPVPEDHPEEASCSSKS